MIYLYMCVYIYIYIIYKYMIAYGEQYKICDLWRRRFSFRTRDQASYTQNFVWQKFYYTEKWQKASDIDIRRETESCPTVCLNKTLVLSSLIHFYQTHSHNIHFKLTRLELTIERSYQTHSHNIYLKITRLVRRFLLRRRNMPLNNYIVFI